MSSDHASKNPKQVSQSFDDDSHFRDNTKNPKANQNCPNDNPFIEAFGHKWWINYHWSEKTGTYVYGKDGVFRSNFDPRIIKTDGKSIDLNIIRGQQEQDDSKTSEIVLADKLGYGHYAVYATMQNGSFDTLDPNAVFGIFTYQYSNAPSGVNVNREIDCLEVISPDQKKQGHAQFTLQPWTMNAPRLQFSLPKNMKGLTSYMRWGPGELECRLYQNWASIDDIIRNDIPPVESWMPSKSDPAGTKKFLPDHTDTSCERFHINLWLLFGKRPKENQSVKIESFEYKPL